MRQDAECAAQARLDRMIGEAGLSVVQAHTIADKPGLADYYDAVVAAGCKPQAAVNLILGDLSRLANETGTPVHASSLEPALVAELVAVVDAGTITSKTQKALIERFYTSSISASATATTALAQIIEAEGLSQVSDSGAIDALAADVLSGNEKIVADYRAGKTKVMGFLVGQVMKRSGGKANPALAEARLRAALGEPEGTA
ncbi:MAG: hypothetical protein PVSMB8_12140 [Vulcanimicrobiaceae bacterium]